MSILRRIFPILLTAALLCACVQMPNTPQDVLPAPTPQTTAAPAATPETSPTPTPEPTVAPAMATATSNATKDAPQIKDPTTWDDNAAKTLAGLETQFSAYGLTLDAKEGCPYLLAVNNAGGVSRSTPWIPPPKSTLCRSWRWCAAAAWTPPPGIFRPRWTTAGGC